VPQELPTKLCGTSLLMWREQEREQAAKRQAEQQALDQKAK
jgi:hypothetical protein